MQACPGGAGRVAIPDLTTRTSAMSSQAAVHSIDELKNFRVALALYGEDTLGTLGAVEAEVRRTLRWLEEERPAYWHDQIKRRREQVAMARAEVFRRNLTEAARLHAGDVRAERSLAQGRGQLARRREAADHGPEVAADVPARRARVSRERSASQGPGRRRCPQCRQPADPDHRRPRGLSPGRATVGRGLRQRGVRGTRAPAPAPLVSIATTVHRRDRGRDEAEAAARARGRGRGPHRRRSARRSAEAKPARAATDDARRTQSL